MTAAPGLVDTHAHVMDAAFDADRDAVLQRAAAAGVARLLAVGYSLPTSRGALDLARQRPDTFRASVGIHPNDAGAAPPEAYAEIERLAQAAEVVAIGETGLDYFRDRTSPARQRESLAWHLDLAERRGLPVVIHNRQADADVADALEAFAARRSGSPDSVPGVLHCFSSEDPTYLRRMLDAGYLVSFAGPLTFRGTTGLQEMARRVPLDRLLVETDCPYLAPQPERGRRNEPAFVAYTARRLAELKDVPYAALVAALWTNSCRLIPAFALDPLVQEAFA